VPPPVGLRIHRSQYAHLSFFLFSYVDLLIHFVHWHRILIWPGELLKGWLKHSSEFSGSFTAAVVRHEGGNLRRINYNTTTIESFILNLLSQPRVRDLTSQLESLRHVAVENSKEINFVETREYDLQYSSEDLLSLLDFPWLFRPKVYLHRTTTWGCAVFDTRRGNWRWGVRFVKVKVKFA
jgi:hypothetical protein